MQNQRILIYSWNAYNDLDVEQTFRMLGYEVDLVKRGKKTYDRDLEFEGLITEKIRKNDYAFFFTMNYFPAISNVCQEHQLKYVCWTCDNPLIGMYDRSVFNSCNIIFTFDKSNYMEFKSRGVKHIYHMPLAVNAERIAALPGFGTGGYKDEISFVGSLYTDRNAYDEMKDTFPDYLKGYLDAAMQARLCIPDNQILEDMLTPDILQQIEESYHLEKSEDSFSDLGLIFSTTVLGFKIASMQRRRALIALSKKHTVSLYNKEVTKDLLRIRYQGPADYWQQMPFIFSRSKMNLNFTIPNIRTGLPLRILDVLGAGGFLLTNFQAEIPDYFKDGRDLVCFYNEKDLLEKADYYLAHDTERQKIAQSGYAKVCKYHTYRVRMQEMLQIISKI